MGVIRPPSCYQPTTAGTFDHMFNLTYLGAITDLFDEQWIRRRTWTRRTRTRTRRRPRESSIGSCGGLCLAGSSTMGGGKL